MRNGRSSRSGHGAHVHIPKRGGGKSTDEDRGNTGASDGPAVSSEVGYAGGGLRGHEEALFQMSWSANVAFFCIKKRLKIFGSFFI